MNQRLTSVFIGLLLASIDAASICAQPAQFPEWYFETLTTDDGLNFRDVVAVEQDEYGFMWFGTTQGLIRYDGYQFKLYNSEKDNPLFIPEEAIGVGGIVSAGDDRLWFLGHSKLFSLNISTDEVRSFGFDHGIRGDVSVMALDGDNRLWIVTDDFYSNPTFPGQGRQYLQRQISPDSFAVVHTVPRLKSGFTSISRVPGGKIRWSTLSGGQLLFANDGKLVETIRPDSSVVLGEKIYAGQLHYRADGDMFFTTGENEIRRYNRDDNRYETVYETDEVIYTAREDHKGNLWFGSARSIYLMNPEGVIRDLTPIIREKLAFGETHQFFLDQQNLFWIATDFGLLKVKSADQLFDQFLNTSGNKLTSPMRGFAEGADGSIIVMNEYERQLYRVSADDEVMPYDLACDTGQAVTSVLNAARFFTTDRSNRYAYTANKHILQIDLLDNSCKIDTSISPYPDVYNLNPVEILGDGRLVAGHTLATLQIYDPSTGTSDLLLARDAQVPAIENVRFILESKQPGIVWVGTHENGVFKLRVGGGIEQHLSINSNPALTKNSILVLHEDLDTSLWIGTFGGGINHYLPNAGKIQYYDVDDGLSDNNVVGILQQSDSVLWISTYNGLSRFNTQSISFKNLYLEDGLTHNEFNYASFYKDRSGRFYFGGMNGFIRFSPDSYVPARDVLPAPRFTSLTRYDRRANETVVSDLIQDPLDILTISPYDAYFQLNWTMTSYFNNSLNRYYFKMEGLDDDWTFVENRPFIRFNRLDPGRYLLRVRAQDFRGNDAAAELTLPVYVKQIFYKSWWFIGLCILLISVLVYAFFQYRLRRLLEIEKLRTKISSDLHDDLGSMLSGLAMQSEILELHAREEDKLRLKKIASTSRSAVHRMRDLVWSIDARKDKVSDLIDKIQETAEDLLSPAGFRYMIHAEEFRNQSQKLNVEARQNIFLVVKEALNNIVKHSDGDTVEIWLHDPGDRVQLRIRDNGGKHASVSREEAMRKTGQGLMNMKMRVEHLRGHFRHQNGNGFEILADIPAKHIYM